jgi:hypothetical protein
VKTTQVPIVPSFVAKAPAGLYASEPLEVGHILKDPRAAGDNRDVIALSVKCNNFVNHAPTDRGAPLVYLVILCF